MKKFIIYKTLYSIALVLCFLSCSNEEEIVPVNNSLSIHVSIKGQNALTRSDNLAEILDIEKIKRYDIFMYNSIADTLSKHIGKDMDGTESSFEATFDSEATFKETQKVFVVVNSSKWKDASLEDLKKITPDSLENMMFKSSQHYEGTQDAMTAFKGYQIADKENEPFIMTAKANHNFYSERTLNVNLKRTYAKVILVFTSSLTAADTEWIGLKEMTIKGFNCIPDSVRLFGGETTSTDFIPGTKSYTYARGFEDKYSFDKLNLLTVKDTKANVFDTFQDTLSYRLRVFPHAPRTLAETTSIHISFALGPVEGTAITKTFNRNIIIGDEAAQYRIDPNTAYIVTIQTSKTDGDIKVTTKVAPWNLVYADFPVTPN